MSLFPDDDKARKLLPVFKMITRYFPKALREVTRVCVANNARYNPERKPEDINWARGLSPDQLGSAFRHMLEAEVDGKVFETATDGTRMYVLAEAAWRVLAVLELEIEKQEALLGQSAAPGRGDKAVQVAPITVDELRAQHYSLEPVVHVTGEGAVHKGYSVECETCKAAILGSGK